MQVSAKKLIAINFCILLFLSIGMYALAQTPTATIWISPGIYPRAPTYTIWRDGSDYFAKTASGLLSSNTNASLLIQSIIDGLSAPASLFFKNGVYILDILDDANFRAIDLVSDLRIYGEDRDQTILKVQYSGLAYSKAFDGVNVCNVTFEDMTISGEDIYPMGTFVNYSSGSPVGIYIYNTGANEIYDFTFRNMRFRQMWYSIFVSGSAAGRLKRVLLDGCIDTTATETPIGSQALFQCYRGEYVQIINCITYVADTAFRLSDVKHVLISGNILKYGTIEIGHETTDTYGEDIVIDNNYLESSQIGCVLFTNSGLKENYWGLDGLIISNNVFHLKEENDAGGFLKGRIPIFFADSSVCPGNLTGFRNVLIVNNQISAEAINHSGDLIKGMITLGRIFKMTIQGNILRGAGKSAICLQSVQGLIIDSNIISRFNRENKTDLFDRAGIAIRGRPGDQTYWVRITNNHIDGEGIDNTIGIYLGQSDIIATTTQIYQNSLANCEVFIQYPHGDIKENLGYITENSDESTGTGGEQTIAHGLANTPTYVWFTNIEDGANAYQSSASDGTNIYVTAVNTLDYGWKAEYIA